MRMRKKKHGAERLAACAEYLIAEPAGGWRRRLPAELEIGCGKGGFICETAGRHPDIFYIAVELSSDALVTAVERAKAQKLPNVLFLNLNASRLEEYLRPGDVGVIYLNFSDPWPKKGHAKRRLTYRTFLAEYSRLLAPGGKVCFKTDNPDLFAFSKEEFLECGWRLDMVTDDLHSEPYAADNVMTEYEKNFSEKGVPIRRLEAYPPATDVSPAD